MSFRPNLRQGVGALILAGTIGSVVLATSMHQAERPRSYTVGFIRGDRLADDADAVEAEAVSLMAAYPAMKARVVGYTEPGGDADANVALSVARAQKVRDAMIARGIDGARIAASGAGGSNPARVDGESDTALAHRAARAEIRIER